ncbi:hypothetical protein CN296_24215 [Bacillus cereus]|nr:hypothetical protein CN296_24215 [Bacillus cereus]
MYTTQWASNFSGFTNSAPMDLHKFVLFFEEHIANRIFHYTTDNAAIPSFIIDSRAEQLPHLMGLQYWNNIHVKQGSKQYELLISGKWDMSFLSKADNGAFKEFKERIESMPYLYNMLYKCDCEIKQIHPVMDSPFKRRRINMIFQKQSSKLAHILELREKNTSGKDRIYVPTSFSVYPKKAKALVGKHTKLNTKLIRISQ